MAAWKRRLLKLIGAISYLGDLLRFRVSSQLGMHPHTPIIVAAYRGYGRTNMVKLTGRVLQDRFIQTDDKEERLWRNLVNTVKRFNSNEINGAKLQISIGHNSFSLTTDAEGYFNLSATLPHPITEQTSGDWLMAPVHLENTPWQSVNIWATAEILIPRNATFGVISDLDDTVIQTGVTSILKLRTIYNTILKSARTRKAIHEVNAFFKALHQYGAPGTCNPFFYVSNSPWNLYDLLEEFLDYNELPKGPILLRDFGLSELPTSPGHKLLQVEHILQTYPNLKFLLVGDSGERDTDIYLQIARQYPDRIIAILIHDVKSKKRALRIQKLIEQTPEVNILLFQQYRQAADYCAGKSLLSMDDFRAFL